MKNYKELLNEAEILLKDVTDTNSDSNAKIISAAVVGLAVGAVLGILFAPEKGVNTRNNISESLSNAGNVVKDKAKQGMDKITDLKNQAADAFKSKVYSNGNSEPSPVA